MNRIVLLLLAVSLVAAVACESREPAQQLGSKPPAGTPAAPAGEPAAGSRPAPPLAEEPHSVDGLVGTVVETMDAGGYTYVHLELADGNRRWAAGPETVIAVGNRVALRNAMVQERFYSPTLERTFDRIDFATALDVLPGATAVPTTAAADDTGVRRGTVTETMDAGGYTYVHLELEGGARLWAAGPQTPVAVGDRVALPPGHPMTDFHSQSLGRTFETIDFVPAIEVAGSAAAPSAPTDAAAPPGAEAAEPIEKLPDGVTVAEIVTGREGLAGQEVAVRGRVTRFNPGILGTNWIHIQDGSGDPSANTHDLTVTAPAVDKLAIGQVIVVRGKVALDRDFGAGYVYPVLLEDARVE